MKKEKENILKGLRLFMFIVLGVLLLPSASSQGPPVEDQEDCLFYAYSSSQNHYFLLQNNSLMYGNNLTFVHNCDFIRIYKNNQFIAESNNSIIMNIDPGMNNITIETHNKSRTYQVQIIPDRLQWEYQYNELLYQDEPAEFIEINLSNSRANYASIFSIIIVWVLTTYVYWRLIESYVNKNFIEEVVK